MDFMVTRLAKAVSTDWTRLLED